MNNKFFIAMVGIQGKEEYARRIFQQEGLSLHFFPVQQYEQFPEEKIVQITAEMPEKGWLIFSSAFTVKLVKALKPGNRIWLTTMRVGVVGETTFQSMRKRFPEKEIIFQADSLQEALSKISAMDDSFHRVVHLTSMQSFASLQPEIPENVLLHRIPIYQLKINKKLIGKIPPELGSRPTILVVPSPSAFSATMELWGKKVLKFPLTIITLGKTTAEYIYKQARISQVWYPAKPGLPNVARLIKDLIETQKLQEIV